MNPNIAGMMGSFNIRFAQPGDIAELYDPGADGPLWWSDYDRHRARRPAWGLLHRCTRDQHLSEDHGDLRRSGGLVQPRHGRHRRHRRAPRIFRFPTMCAATIIPGTTHGGGAGGFNLGTASTNPDSFAANPNPQPTSTARSTSR